MLLSFKVSGFRCFKEPFTWNLAAQRYTFNSHLIRNKVVSKALILEESGNRTEDFGLALFDIYNHLSDPNHIPASYLSHYLHPSARTAVFTYTFQFDSDTIVYEYAKRDARRLVYEKVWLNGTQVLDTDVKVGNKHFRQVSPLIYDGPELEPDPQIASFVDQVYQALPEDDKSPLTRMVQFVEGMALYETLTQKGLFTNPDALISLEQDLYRLGDLKGASAWLRANGYPYVLSFSSGKNALLFSESDQDAPLPFLSCAPHPAAELLLFFLWMKAAFSRTQFLYIGSFDTLAFGTSAETVLEALFEQRSFQSVIVSHNTHLVKTEWVRPDSCFLMRKNRLMPLFAPMTKEIRVAQNLEKMYWDGVFND
ncbi:MAG: hypothetical protein IJT60_07210 [Clostridia bacterium]|nr:hypothetical protein [Clostridia bacterium]